MSNWLKKVVILSLIITIPLTTYFVFYSNQILPVKLEAESEFVNNTNLTINGVGTIHINDSEYLVILETSKLMILNYNGETILEKEVNFTGYLSDITDLDGDGNDEIVIKDFVNGNQNITILNYKLEEVSTLTLVNASLIIQPISFVDCDGDGSREILFIQGFYGSKSVKLKILTIQGEELFEHEFSENGVHVNSTYAFTDFYYAKGKINNGQDDYIIVFVVFSKKENGAYVNRFHTHIIAISRYSLLWEKIYEISPIKENLIQPIDIDKDNNTEFLSLYDYSGLEAVGLIEEDGTLILLDIFNNPFLYDVTTATATIYDYNNDSYRDILFALGISNNYVFNNTALLLKIDSKNLKINLMETESNGNPIGVINRGSNEEPIFILENNTHINFVSLNGKVVKSLKLDTRFIEKGLILDIDLDKLNEIVVIGESNLSGVLYVINTNGSLDNSFNVIGAFENYVVIPHLDDYSIAVWTQYYLLIYSKNGDICRKIVIDLKVPNIIGYGTVAYENIDIDKEKEIIISTSNLIYLYHLGEERIEKIETSYGYYHMIQVGNLDGDSLADFILYEASYNYIIALSHNNETLFIHKIKEGTPTKILTANLDGDKNDEIVILMEIYNSNDSKIIILDNNGTLINSFKIQGIKATLVEDITITEYKGEIAILIVAKAGNSKYTIEVYQINGTRLWSYNHHEADLNIKSTLSILCDDLDGDGEKEVIIVTKSSLHGWPNEPYNVTITLIKLGEGFTWEKNLEENKEIYIDIANSESFTWNGEKVIGLSYVYYPLTSTEFIIKHMLINKQGNIIQKKVIKQTRDKWTYRYYKAAELVNKNGTFYCVTIYRNSYSHRINKASEIRVTIHQLTGSLHKTIILPVNIDDSDYIIYIDKTTPDSLLKIIIVKDYAIYSWEITL